MDIKKFLHIIRRILLPLFLVVYVVVALCNYSIVQSYLAHYFGDWLSSQSGGKVTIGSMYVNPLGQVIVKDAEVLDPKGDTVLVAERLSCRFSRFPVNATSLRMDAVMLSNAYFHFATRNELVGNDTVTLTNLQFLIDVFASEEPSEPSKEKFDIKVRTASLRNVRYKMDIADGYENPYPYGVDIAHMEYRNINARFKGIHVVGDNINCRVVSFSTVEKSGFAIRNMSADILVSPYKISATNFELNTDSTRILADAMLEYDGWEGMSDFCNDVQMTLKLRPGSIGGLSDACYWAPDIWGVDQRVAIEGDFHGPIADMYAENVIASFGDSTEIYFDGHIKGLPYIETTTIDAEISSMRTCYEDLANVRHPEYAGFYAADILKQLGLFEVQAEFHGDCQNCVAAVNLYSDMCNLSADAAVAYNEHLRDYEYRADISSNSIDLSALVDNKWVSRTGLSIAARGRGMNLDHLKASLEGELFNTMLRNNSIDVTSFSVDVADQVAKLDLRLDDTLAHISIDGRFNLADTNLAYNGRVNVRNCNLTALNLVEAAEYPMIISGGLSADLRGTDLNLMEGTVDVADLNLRANGDSLLLHSINLALDRKRHNRKQLTLKSDCLKADLSGYYDYGHLSLLLRQFCDSFLPQYYNPYREDKPTDESLIADHYLNLDLRWTGRPRQLKAIVPDLSVATGTSIHCSYNYLESFKVVLRSDSLAYGAFSMHDLGMQGSRRGDGYKVNLDADHLSFGKVDLLRGMDVVLDSRPQDAALQLKWGKSDDAGYRGDIGIGMTSTVEGNQLSIIRPTFYIDGARWTLICPEGLQLNNEEIRLGKLKLTGNGQSLSVDALIAGQYNDQVNVSFSDFQIAGLLGLIIQDDALAIGGVMNGRGSLYGLNDSPYFNASVKIDDCTLGDQSLGLVDAIATWNAELNQLNLDLKTIQRNDSDVRVPISADGYIELGGDNPSLDFDIEMDQFDLATISPLVSSFSSHVTGKLSGEVSATGKFSSPTIIGGLHIEKGALLVDATGVEYSFTDSIYLDHNNVCLRNFTVTDDRNNKAYIDGRVNCSDLSNITTDLKLHSSNILALNSSKGETYYGTLFVAADARVKGPISSLEITGKVRTNPGSSVTVPVTDHREVASQNYITFISDQPEENLAVRDELLEQSETGLSIHADINVTPDLKLTIPMDFVSQMFVNVGASGEGNLHFDMEDAIPLVTGRYEISDGSLGLNLAQLISRRFVIEQGSVLEFPGDLSNVRFDLSAVYSLRTNVSSLTGGMAANESSQKSITVEDVFKLSGTIDDLEFGFDIRMPNADQSVQEEVFAYIDRSNERDMLNQSISLLVLGQFSNASNMGSSSDNNSSANGYQMMANTMGNIVSSMVNFVDLNFDYKAATELTTEQFELDISKQWNKFYFESSFGYGGDSRNNFTNSTNTLLGDMLVGYKLSPRVHLFMFNRTNTNDYTRTDLPYRQGMGLKFTRDFDNWSELFRIQPKNNKPESTR